MKSKTSTYVGGRQNGYAVFLTRFTDVSADVCSYLRGIEISQVIVVVDTKVYALHTKILDRLIRGMPWKATLLCLPISEKKKNSKTLLDVIDKIISCQVDRSSIIIAVGGGVTTDIAGCAAALTLRGIRWGVIPTTLLGMVDAAIGGKTGVNTKFGKNLLGAFWNPQFVALAPEFTATQSDREFSDGLAEVLKYSAIVGSPSLRAIENALSDRSGIDGKTLAKLVFDSAKVKANIVSKDPREQGVRAWLNFGHTFAHAIEATAGYGAISHGRAVAAGIIAALSLSQSLGMLVDGKVERIATSARSIATGKAVPIDIRSAIQAMGFDKKRVKNQLNFVLLQRVGEPYLRPVSDRRLVYRSMEFALDALK
ncbi:3-dehydroquinate synthase [Gemmatimonas aurantiaca]|nr:3-dehydroquinate synthase [Gemmatimonas aurantiaca]